MVQQQSTVQRAYKKLKEVKCAPLMFRDLVYFFKTFKTLA